MEIGLIYSKEDPRQAEARDFVEQYVREHGMFANITESVQPVKSPTVIIDGEALKDQRRKPRGKKSRMYPAIEDIARALEEHLWSL